MATNTDEREEIKPVAPTEQTKWRDPSLVGKYMVDPKTGLAGLFRSPDNGETWVLTDTVYGHVYNQDEVDNIWDNGAGHKVADEIKSATADLPNVRKQADSAVKFAESAVAASKVNSDAIVAQSEAISEAKSAMDSATAEIQQTAANAASDAAKIRADVARVQNEVDTAKTANSASVEALKSDIDTAKQDLANVHDSLDKAQAAAEQNQKAIDKSVAKITSDVSATKQDLANVHDSLDKAQAAAEQNQKAIDKSVAKITSDVSATKQDLATVHDSLTKAQAAAEQNQKAINDSIAEINANVDATNQDLAGVRKDLTKAQSDITANQKAIDDNVAQISDDITQDRKDIADVRQGLTKAQSDIIANQKAVNDNVAQINSDIEQDRKDIASAQQANADTVKQLDAYSKQAQEQGKTIKAVQDKQDGFSATLADVQGNVSQVSDKVSGLSASLKDAQDNVASVKAQADQLSATLTDHSKSIAILTASAKELSSTLEDADGRLSKVEQTAQTNSSTLSDVQGDLSQVKQNATKLVSTLKDAQGNISTLQQKADSLSTQLASAQGDIATLQTGIDGVKAILTSHDKSIHTLQADSKSLKDSMVNAQGDISTLRKTATDVTSKLEDHTGRLSKVEQSAAKQATTLSDLQGNLSQVKQQADGLVTTLKDAQGDITQIQQKADGTLEQLKSAQGDIASLQTDVTGIKATLTSHEGDIHTLQADSKTLKDDMQDAQGNISSLQKSSTKLDSEMSSQDGRLSKVEQTAKEHTSTISDLGKKVDSNGGGVNLLTNSQGPFRPTQKNSSATVSDNYDVYNSDVYMVQGQTYTVSGQTNGTWSGTHDTEHVSDNCVLWLTDNSNVSQIISADTMPHTFTWPYPTKSYHLRVNAYHHGADNPIYAEKVKIERGSVATPYSPAPEDLATVTQVKQTADGIETTLKSAQGDIDQIKQTAKGTSEQLSNVQGDVTNIQKDVNGLKQTTADNAGNIHTLQSDSKTLQDDMKDAKGNISSLQKTSTSLVSEFRDHDGRLSKVEQTATEHTSELADTKGNLDKVTQKANTLQLLLSDAQKNIQNIQLDAKGLHDTLTGQNNQLANLNVTLNDLDSKYSGITGDLQSKQTALSTEQQQTKDMLLRKADKSEVDNVKKTSQQLSSSLDIMADQIKSKVTSTDVNNIVDGKGYATTSTVQSLVDQKAGTINESIVKLSGEVNNNNGGGINLLKATDFANTDMDTLRKYWGSSFTIRDGVALQVDGLALKSGSADATQVVQVDPDTDYTLSFEVHNNAVADGGNWNKIQTFLWEFKDSATNKTTDKYADNARSVVNTNKRNDNIQTIHTQPDCHYIRVIFRANPKVLFSFVKPKLERGNTATPYSPAPSDNATVTQLQSVTASIDGLQSRVTNYQNDTSSKYTQLSNLMQSKVGTADFEQLKRSVDMQTLDSADINNMKTNGHYFVHNLTNSPIAGWVYVDVTGNGNNRIRQDVYQDNGIQHKYRRWVDTHWTGWEEGATYTEITQLQDAVNLRVQKGELLSQINLTAGNTLIQSNKLYLDASSVVITGTAFIPSAAIASLNADKVNTGWLNTNNVNLGDGRTRIRADHDYMYIQPTGSAASNTGIRMGYSGLDFLTNVIPNGYSSSVPYYSVGYDGAANGYFKISAFDHINPGGATATQNWFTMYDAISLNNKEVNIAANNKPRIRVTDKGIEVRPTIFFNNENYSGTWAGFNRLDNSNTVEFNTGDNDGENFHVNSGARFMKYVYFNDYCRAQGWLTYSTLSKKTNIKKLDTSLALDKIRQDDQYLYEYKRNVAKGVYDPQASFIIDDVNDVSHYSVPREFIDQTGKYREPSVELSYLIAAFQEIDKQVQLQKEEIKELKEKLQHE